MIKALCTYMAAGLGLTIGTNLFAGKLPPAVDALSTAVLTRTGAVIDSEIKELRHQPIQIFTRGPEYHTADAEANRVCDWLVNQHGVAITGWTILSITGNGPAWLSTDAKGRDEFVANLLIRARKES